MFNPKKSFFELPVVRWAIGIHVVIASASALAILITGDYGFSPTADGFNLFLTDFKFPIGVLAMLIPVVALLATNHRSEQTKEQIRVTEDQNIFANYFKHYEEFDKYSSELEMFKFNTRYFYNIAFSGARNGDYGINRDFYSEINELAKYFYDAMKDCFINLDSMDYSRALKTSETVMSELSNFIEIVSEDENTGYYEVMLDDDLIDFCEIVDSATDYLATIDKLMSFDDNYIRSEIIINAMAVSESIYITAQQIQIRRAQELEDGDF